MCGIFALIEASENKHQARMKAVELAHKLQHRGPDDAGVYLIVIIFIHLKTYIELS